MHIYQIMKTTWDFPNYTGFPKHELEKQLISNGGRMQPLSMFRRL